MSKYLNNKLVLLSFFIIGSILIYPPYNLGFLSWVLFIPLLFFITHCRYREILWLIPVYIIINLFLLFWLKDINTLVYLFISFFASIVITLPWFLVKYFIKTQRYLLIPILLTLAEYLRTFGDYGFPLQVIGYSQAIYPMLIQLADIGGVWIISFIIYSVNLLILILFSPPRGEMSRTRDRGGRFISIIFLIIIGYSFVYHENKIGEIRVGLIQPNVNMFFSDWEKKQDYYFKLYEQLSLQASAQSPELIIWPETAIGLSLRNNRLASKRVRNILDEVNTDLLVGNLDERPFSLKFQEKYNSAFYITKEGKVIAEHYKTKLIPVLETINYQLGVIPYNIRNKIQSGLYSKGNKYIPIRLTNYSAAVIICFESIFGDHVRRFTAQGTNIIYNLSSDGWSLSLAEHQFNFNVNIFRAIENRQYVVRVSDNGISGIISPTGQVLKTIPAFKQGVLVAAVPLVNNSSFYKKYGDFFIWVLIFLFIYGLIKQRFLPLGGDVRQRRTEGADFETDH